MKSSLRPITSLAILILSILLLSQNVFRQTAISSARAESRSNSPERTADFQYAFQNPDLPIEERVDNILSLMTLDEKIECLGNNPSVPRLGIKGSGHVEGIHGLAQGVPGRWGRPKVVPTTTFPQGIGLAETWDTEAVRQAGAVEGYEARYIFQSSKYHQGGIVVRAPNADLGRDPRWGRTEECYGEDPYFNGTMVVSFIKGLQGDDPRYLQTAALMKHFLANSNENHRESSSSDFDERLFREYYSVPFRMGVIDGGSRAFMASYNAVNGVPMAVNPILQTVTRDEWGEDGIICTDGGAMRLLVTGHKYFPDFEHAAAAVVKAGIGQFLDNYRDAIRGALMKNLLTETDIDKALRGNFRVMIRLGLLDPPERVRWATIGREAEDPWLSDKHRAIARVVTQKSIVLLKNTNDLLPLDKRSLKSVAVIGPRANEVDLDWYSGTPPYTVTPLEGIKTKLGPGVNVSYAADNDNGAAIKIARSSDVAIVVVGNHPTCNAGWEQCPTPSDGKEAVDRRSIDLEQEELIKQVYQANPRTVVVLVSSFPFAINWTQNNVPAILHMAHNSQEEGNALADVVFGDYNPAGRLVQTWPRSLDQLPPMMDYNIRNGRTYMYFKGDPLYPFGYGLSYTTYVYSKLRTSSSSLSSKGSIDVSIEVKNTGTRAGEEVVQLYVKHLNSSVQRPIKELKGFTRVLLQPGQTKTVTLPLKASQLAYWDSSLHSFVVEQNSVQLFVGRSSADTKLNRTVRVAP
jgi:beta-glucosidase